MLLSVWQAPQLLFAMAIAVSMLMLEIGREPVYSGDAAEAVLKEAEDDLVRDAMSLP